MASARSLSGLMKWLARDEWRDAFEDILERHLLPPCRSAGVEIDGLPDLVGEGQAATLWGCAFEDFLATEFADGSNIVDHYLKRRGWNESVPNKRYMTALRSSVMSLYEVSDIVRDQSFLARDLLRGGEPVRISERSATRGLKPWDRLAARVVTVGPRIEMSGGALTFSHELGQEIVDDFAEIKEEKRAEVVELLRDRQDGRKVDEFMLDTELLRHGALLFTNLWLDDALERILHPSRPTMLNSDGDPIVLTIVRYRLRGDADRAALERALTALPSFHRADENVWNWTAPPPRKPPRGPEGAQTFTSIFEDGSVSMGRVELEADALTLEANSPQRAQKGRAFLDHAIGRFVEEPTVASKTVAEMTASRPAKEEQDPASGLSPEEESGILHDVLDRHYRGLLDQPVPMLGNVSPRKAAKTRKGREKLVDWLKLLENIKATQEGSPMAAYDTRWLWEELGVADLRR